MLKKLINLFGKKTDFDHFDMDEIDTIARERGLSADDVRKAFFVARDLSSLRDFEKLEGGSGRETKRTNVEELKKSTFSKGEGKV